MYHFSSSKSLAQSPECNSVNFMMLRTCITNDLNPARGRSSVADASESSRWRMFVYVLCQPPMERAWDCSRIKVQKVTSLCHLFVICFLLYFPLFYHNNSHPLPSTRRWVGACSQGRYFDERRISMFVDSLPNRGQ